MGVGRRMKKQGAPEPLDEAHFTTLKRKAGMSVMDARRESEKNAPNPKRRRSNGEKNKQDGKSGEASKGKPKSTQSVPLTSQKSALKKSKKPAAVPLPQSDEDDDDSDALMNDEFDVAGSDGGMGDALDSGSDVYDSGEDHAHRAMFSEDEDESDAEEKLTAANIVGLTRKLDKEQADQEAEAKAELQEAALQTNIEGDRLLLDDSDEENEGVKTNALLAPDLQMLRQRINDTIRVLKDKANFAKYAEEGRSRAEYEAQVVKDICLYYGYSPYLCQLLFNLFPPSEAFAFFEANETPRPVVIRTNTIRTHRRDSARTEGHARDPTGRA